MAKATDAADNVSEPSAQLRAVVDIKAPSVVKVTPVEDARGVGPGTGVVATFPEQIKAGSLTKSFFLYKSHV